VSADKAANKIEKALKTDTLHVTFKDVDFINQSSVAKI
jgi:hypothetical protein